MKIAVIGAGVMGKNHARVLSSLNSLGGVVDADPEVAKMVASRYGVNYSTDIDLDFDAAVIATPIETHYALAKKVMEMGKHVLVEKPFTHSVEQAQELIDLAKEMGLVLMVGHIERFNPIVEFFKNLNGKKELITINAKRVSGFPHRIRDVGVIMDLGVHEIDVFRYLVGDIVEVYARGGRIKNDSYEDHASMLFSFKNGKHGYIETNWLTPKKIRKLWLTFTDCYAKGDHIGQWVELSSEKLAYDEFNAYNIHVDLNIQRINLKREEPLKRELQNFIQAIEKRDNPMVTGEDGLAAVKIAQAALKSMYDKKPVEID